MKEPTLLKGILITTTAFIIGTIFFLGCKKGIKDINTAHPFDSNAAKEWYYGYFKKSPEFKQSKESGRKLPDWKHGIYRKVGEMEIVEFPLKRHIYLIPISRFANTTQNEMQQMATGSLSRVVIIKKADGSIYLREIYYVPKLEFLKSRNYDISDVHLGINNSGNFTGAIIIKTWNGATVSRQLLTAGKVTAVGKVRANTAGAEASSTGACEIWEICEMERQCVDYYSGDEWVEQECTGWVPTGFCWYEEYCEPDELCDYGGSESCECQLFGTGCLGDGNGGSDVSNCSNVEEEAMDYWTNEWSKHIKSEVPIAALNQTSYSPPGDNNVFYDQVNTWTIAESWIGIWRIEAKVRVTLSYDNYSINNHVNMQMQHISSYYVGTNNLITTTWKEDPVQPPKIIGNHTDYPKGTYFVTGTITHSMKGDLEYEKNGCKIKKNLGLESVSTAGNSYTHKVF